MGLAGAFLFSIVLVGVGLYVRVSISETPVFRRAMETQTRARVPALDMVRAYPAVLLLASGGISLAYVLFYTITTFSLSYGTGELGLRNSTLLYATLISVTITGLAVPVFATLSDRLGRRNLCMAGALLALLWAFPMFWLFDTGSPVLITFAFSVGMLAFAVLYGPMGAYLPELFGTRLRYPGGLGQLQSRRRARRGVRPDNRVLPADSGRRVVGDLALHRAHGPRQPPLPLPLI